MLEFTPIGAALAAEVIAARAAAAVWHAAHRRTRPGRSLVTARAAWRSRPAVARYAIGPACAMVLLLVLRATGPGTLVVPLGLGISGGAALLGLVALLAGGTEEREGRPATARHVARACVPWIAIGSLAATVTVCIGAPTIGAALLALGGAVGALGGLARKPRPAAAIGLLLHVVGLALAAGA